MLRLLFKKSETTELRNLCFVFFPLLVQPLKNYHTSKNSSHPHLLFSLFLNKYIFTCFSNSNNYLIEEERVLNLWGAEGTPFAYQTLFFRPQGSWVLFFNRLRLTPCKWSRCQTPINQHLREPTSVEDIVMKANPNRPHPVGSNCETVAYPSVECFVKKKGKRGVSYCIGGRLKCYFAFVGNSITSLAHLPASDHQLSAIKISCPRPVCHSTVFSLSVCIHLQIFW